MRKHLQGIDHVVIAVADLDQAAADFTRLGFTLTARGRHTMGSENHCAMFPDDYFELLAVPADHPVTRYYSDFLAHGGDGLAALALKTDDASGFYGELASAGIDAAEPVDFSRPVSLADGVRDAAFRITQVDREETPGGRVFACQHFTRDVVWRPDDQIHANGVIGLQRISVLCAAEHFAVTRHAYEYLFDRAAQGRGDDGANWQVATGNTPLQLLTRAAFSDVFAGIDAASRALPFFGALHFRVRSLDETRRVLEHASVSFTRLADGSIAVSAALTHGLVIVFTELQA